MLYLRPELTIVGRKVLHDVVGGGGERVFGGVDLFGRDAGGARVGLELLIACATWSINCPAPARDSEARRRPSSNSKEAEARDSGLPGIATRSTETCGEIGAGVIGAGALACCM